MGFFNDILSGHLGSNIFISKTHLRKPVGPEVSYTSGPSHAPGDLADLKSFLRVNHDDDDDLLDDLLDTAIEDVEDFLGKTLVQREVNAYWSTVDKYVELPRPPIVSITSIDKVEDDGTSTALTSSDYKEFSSDNFDGRNIVVFDNVIGNQIEAVYQAGYASSFSGLPKRLQKACFHQVRLYYDNSPLSDTLQIHEPTGLVWQAYRMAKPQKLMTEF